MRAIFIVWLCSCWSKVYCDSGEESENTIEDSIIDSLTENTDRMKMDKISSVRAPKFLSFNKEANKLRVEAAFAVPLLTIPVGGETINAYGGHTGLTVPKVDVNLKSVVTVASIFLLVFILLPKILGVHPPPTLASENFRSYMDTSTVDLTKWLSDTMGTYNMDLETCSQKALCWTMNNVRAKAKEGAISGTEKLLDAISSMPYVKYLFEDTWLWSLFQKAIFLKNGTDGNCEEFTKKCAITSKGLNLVAASLLSSIKSS